MNNPAKLCKQIYRELQNREIHPSGHFGGGGRWYADNDDLISCRAPSRAWPYSQMIACRTLKYVKKVCAKYNCTTLDELRARI